MNTWILYKRMLGGFAAALILTVFSQTEAWAVVSDDPVAPPPAYPPCTGSSVQVHPSMKGNSYNFTGQCWINLAADKYDQDHPNWFNGPVSGTGSYNPNNNNFTETISFTARNGGSIRVHESGWCADDPWVTPQDCTFDSQSLRGNVITAVGLDIGNTSGHRGPLSLIVISPNLFTQAISQQESKPPRPPVNVDPVNWPVDNGKSTRVMVSWKAGDMSNNRWVMQFDIQLSQQKTDSDSAYSKAGQVLGLGPKQSFTSSDTSRVYLFAFPNEVKPVDSYYFRVCAVNDSDTQCSTPVQARQPTKQELMSHESSAHVVTGLMNATGGGGKPPTASGRSQRFSVATIAGSGSQATGGNTGGGATGGGGTTPAAAPRVFGGALAGTPGGAAGTGTPGGGGGGPTPGGPAGAGSTAKPDLAVAPEGMLIDDRAMEWNSTNRLVLHEDASHTCPVHVSFKYTNLGKAAATNVVAEVHDNQLGAQTIATGSVPTLAPGQSSTVSGTAKIMASPKGDKITLTAIVYEKGKPQDSNVSHNHGAITLDVICHK